MEFGNKQDLILAKKIQHFSKGKRLDKLDGVCKIFGLLEKLQEKKMVLKSVLNDIDWSQMSRKEKNKQMGKEEKRITNDFLSNHLIPILVDKCYFDSYMVPLKLNKKTKKEEWMWRQFA